MSDKHVLYTGPIKGAVQLPDGTQVDVSDTFVEFDSYDELMEVSHAIGLAWEKTGHPDDVEIDAKSGERVQRKFNYDRSAYSAHAKGKGKRGNK